MTQAIVWFNSILRINDHPAFSQASQDHQSIIPIFIFNQRQLSQKSSNYNHFLMECLINLDQKIKKLGGQLILRDGDYLNTLSQLAQEHKVSQIYTTFSYNPKIQLAHQQLSKKGLTVKQFPGQYIVDDLNQITTKNQQHYQVFTPFYHNWLAQKRRLISPMPIHCHLPSKNIKTLQPSYLNQFIKSEDLSPNKIHGGEDLAYQRLDHFLTNKLNDYLTNHDNLSIDGTSHLSADLNFGTISPLMIEASLNPSTNSTAWLRQMCWREFYAYILYYYPDNLKQEFQTKYRNLQWTNNPIYLQAWQNSQTGYPIIDSAMKQLRLEGFIHNRARLIVASFLTKDLDIDWRLGQRYFEKYLIDHDTASNNGNWQWVTSVGVDPAPMFRRFYNPIKQQIAYDKTGQYVKKYLPTLAQVPNQFLAQPWIMPIGQQVSSNCLIGVDYPLPIVDHQLARQIAFNKYKLN